MGLKLGVMKKREENKNSERAIDSIPLDVMREIFIRLPAKSLLRFRCVSKLWLSITTDPCFINAFAAQSSNRMCLQLSFFQEDEWMFFSLPQKCLSHSHMDNYQITLPKEERYINDFESIRGLISFQYFKRFVIWNPTMRQHITIPKPKSSWNVRSYLGYDPIGDIYKLLCMPNSSNSGPQILTLGAQESWRVIKNSPMHYMSYSGKYINGFLYYETYLINEYYAILADNGSRLLDGKGEDEKTIMSFDVRFEKFKPIKIPPNCTQSTHPGRHALVNYQGKVARVCQDLYSIKFWILDDFEKEEWSCKDFHVPYPPEEPIDEIFGYELNQLLEEKGYYILTDIADDTGEFIFISLTIWCADREAYVLFYDPKKKSTRKVKFEGIRKYENFERGYFLGEKWKFTNGFSNHIECLMSLNNLTFHILYDS